MLPDPEVTLKTAFDTANWFSELSVILVVVGVLIEFIALFIWREGMPRSERIVLIFATFIIAAGCGGEYLFGGRASSDARQLTDIVESKTAAANERAAKIEAIAAWRTLTSDQIVSFVNSLSTSKHKIQIAYMKGDPESEYLAFQFFDAINRAGWEYGSWEVHLMGTLFFRLAVLNKPDNDAVHALMLALAAANIGADLRPEIPSAGWEGSGGYHEAEVTLVIGSKSPPKFPGR